MKVTQGADSMDDLLRIDTLNVTDIPFVFRSWICGMRKSPDNCCVSGLEYFDNARSVVAALMEHEGTHARVLRLKEDPTSICGFVVFHERCLYWMHVKHAFKGFGLSDRMGVEADAVSRSLGGSGLKYYAFRTEHGHLQLPHLRLNGIFVPSLLASASASAHAQQKETKET